MTVRRIFLIFRWLLTASVASAVLAACSPTTSTPDNPIPGTYVNGYYIEPPPRLSGQGHTGR